MKDYLLWRVRLIHLQKQTEKLERGTAELVQALILNGGGSGNKR